MKTIFRLLCGWMAIALAACTGDELQQIEPLQKPVAQKTISVRAYTPSEQAATRLAFTEDKKTEGLKLSWTAGDAFTAVIGNNKVRFEYDEDSKEFTADVNENFELSNGTIAYYPAYDGEIFVRDFSIQTGTLNSATTYMVGVYEGDAFSFNHSTAILKASFGLPPNAVISSIQISGAVDITIANYNSSAAAYINLPVIPKDGQLKFDVRTSDGTLYTATKTVTAGEGIETGVYYNTTVALSPAPVCNLPGYSTTEEKNLFNVAVKSFLQSNPSLKKIKFIANSPATTKSDANDENATEDYSYRLVAGSDNTLEIHTAAAEFVFNEDCSSMFFILTNIQSIDFGNCVNTANVTNMASMFCGCSALTSLNVSSFNTANVMLMNYMFDNCSSLTSLDLSSFNTEKVEYMNSMFVDCYALTSLDLSSFNTEKVEYMNSMFASCLALESLDLSSFNFDKVENFGDMFTNLGSSVTTGKIPVYVTQAGYDILMSKSTGVDGSNAEYALACELPTGDEFNTEVESFLDENSSLTKIEFVANSSNTNKGNPISNSGAYMVANGKTLEIHTAAPKFVFNADCFGMFDGLSTITAIDFNNCINTANVLFMGDMFNGCSALTSLDLSSFNTANVVQMISMFNFCSSLTSLDLSSFNTANVTDMASMFYGCQKLTSLDLSSFNTANVLFMGDMFNGCSALTSLNVSSFNTVNVRDMASMFSGCFSLESLDLSSFDFVNVTDFEDMFYDLGLYATNTPIYIYVKDEIDKIILSATTDIPKYRVIISVKQP